MVVKEHLTRINLRLAAVGVDTISIFGLVDYAADNIAAMVFTAGSAACLKSSGNVIGN
jgi:hypothetical protein